MYCDLVGHLKYFQSANELELGVGSWCIRREMVQTLPTVSLKRPLEGRVQQAMAAAKGFPRCLGLLH